MFSSPISRNSTASPRGFAAIEKGSFAMNRTITARRHLGHVLTGALALALLSGCATKAAPGATVSAAKAEAALAQGKLQQAVGHAEAAVLAEPRSAAYRAMLGDAYLDAGRFASAAASYGDAAALGDVSARTALSHALALTGAGRHDQAAALLDRHRGEIASADLGLALALAGQPERGIQLMGNAIRMGENNAKMRQNLAYSYALAGRWREARVMASQDVPADRIDDRIEEWSRMAHPQAWQLRVAALLDVPAHIADAGQPVHLALANHPSIDQLAEEALAAMPAPAPVTPEPPVAAPGFAVMEPVPAELPPAAPVRAMLSAPAAPVAVAPPPPAPPAAAPADFASAFPTPPLIATPRAAPLAVGGGTHLVQLGSFSSEEGARRAMAIYQRRYPDLAQRQMVITPAQVRGQRYWRVSAAGFGPADSRAMCGRVKARGEGCFAYAEGRPLPGAVAGPIRLASR